MESQERKGLKVNRGIKETKEKRETEAAMEQMVRMEKKVIRGHVVLQERWVKLENKETKETKGDWV